MSLIEALNWMSTQGVAIINMSMSGPHDQVLQEAIERLSRQGVIFIAAAGNEGPSAPPVYPAAYPQVIAVTAVGRDLRSYSYSNHGDYIDVAAPGVGIWTAFPNAMEGPLSGTSFAAPHVTAVVAALYDQVPVKTKDGFLRAMRFRDLGPPGPDRIYGRGLIVASGVCDRGSWVTEVVRTPTQEASPTIASSLVQGRSGRK
jgi:subtilisin family serine protease